MFSTEDNLQLNSELVEEIELKSPRRGSKDELIQRILELNNKAELDFNESLTKLKRRSKASLNELLSELIEKSVQKSMANKLGCSEEEINNDAARSVAFLRMFHDTLCCTVEKLSEPYLNRYNLSLRGYNDSLKNPALSEQIDQCLEEIAQDCDILAYVSSPYSRLALIHLAGISATLKKKTLININNAPAMELGKNERKNTSSQCLDRSEKIREKLSNDLNGRKAFLSV